MYDHHGIMKKRTVHAVFVFVEMTAFDPQWSGPSGQIAGHNDRKSGRIHL
jgi:hypothetical protein